MCWQQLLSSMFPHAMLYERSWANHASTTARQEADWSRPCVTV